MLDQRVSPLVTEEESKMRNIEDKKFEDSSEGQKRKQWRGDIFDTSSISRAEEILQLWYKRSPPGRHQGS